MEWRVPLASLTESQHYPDAPVTGYGGCNTLCSACEIALQRCAWLMRLLDFSVAVAGAQVVARAFGLAA